MKRIIIGVILFFCFIMPVKADLTTTQENDVAFFAEHFILEGSKRIGNDGFPLLAYMQGQARIDGFQSKLYKVGYDYQGINYVNAYKWTFDCATYAAFVYYKTFGLALTKDTTSQVDSYSGLKLDRETANPYTVSSFVANADANKHFYYIMKNVKVPDIDYSKLKKGDLVVIVGSHIMVYVGDGKIAHASSSAITKSNLGLEVVKLANKYPGHRVSIIRIKNKIIDPNKQANMTITWLDNNQVMNFRTLQAVNDKPTISYTKSTNEWVKELVLNVSLKDQDGLDSYVFNGGSSNKISGKSNKFKQTIKENGSYVVTVNDKLGNSNSITINITNIDDKKPLISMVSTSSEKNYSIIKVVATDEESGLHDLAYSFNMGETWESDASFNIYESGDYEIYVRDKAGNIASMKVNVNVEQSSYNPGNNDEDIESDLPKINEVIMGDVFGNKQKIIVMILNDQDNGSKDIIITKDNIQPTIYDNWQSVNGSSYVDYLESGEYYIWLRDKKWDIRESYPITINVISEKPEINDDEIKPTNTNKRNNEAIYVVGGIIFIVIVILVILRKNKRKMFC